MRNQWEGVPLLMMADYLAEPMWIRSPDGRGGPMVRLDELPLSPGLEKDLLAWAARFDRLAETNYEWPTAAERTRWVDAGVSLWHPVQAELGPSFDVEYFHGTSSADN